MGTVCKAAKAQPVHLVGRFAVQDGQRAVLAGLLLLALVERAQGGGVLTVGKLAEAGGGHGRGGYHAADEAPIHSFTAFVLTGPIEVATLKCMKAKRQNRYGVPSAVTLHRPNKIQRELIAQQNAAADADADRRAKTALQTDALSRDPAYAAAHEAEVLAFRELRSLERAEDPDAGAIAAAEAAYKARQADVAAAREAFFARN
ncbi:MAG: hypothetical protein ABR581_05015 [Thermoleophilaceae bacterium]